jgi:hypothetical protein
MNATTLVLIALRGLALTFAVTGRVREAEQLYKLADFVAAGLATDEQMREVADKLAERNSTLVDIQDVLTRIEQERERLHAPPAG